MRILIEAQDDAENIVNAVLTATRNGDLTAPRLVLDRILPARREAAKAMGALVAAVVAGNSVQRGGTSRQNRGCVCAGT